MKIKIIGIIVLNFMIFSFGFAETITLKQAVEIYIANSIQTKNNKMDLEVQSHRQKQIEQTANQNLGVSLKGNYASQGSTLNADSRITYNNFYISASPKQQMDKGDLKTVTNWNLGVTKNINEFFFDDTTNKITQNKYDTEVIRQQYLQSIQNDVETIVQSYLKIKEYENSIKLNQIMIQQKQKDYEIALIKLENKSISAAEADAVKSNLEKLKLQSEMAKIQIDEQMKSLQDLLNLTESNFQIQDLEDTLLTSIYVSDSAIRQIEIQLKKEDEVLKSIQSKNAIQSSADLGYDITNNQVTAGISATYYPLDYKGDEKEENVKILKLKEKLTDETVKLAQQKSIKENEIKKQELTVKMAKEDLNISKNELGKYEVMYKQGAVSEYDYFIKQQDSLNKELEFAKQSNVLKSLKIKNTILYEIARNLNK